jgi:hypothetical protein
MRPRRMSDSAASAPVHPLDDPASGAVPRDVPLHAPWFVECRVCGTIYPRAAWGDLPLTHRIEADELARIVRGWMVGRPSRFGLVASAFTT